MKVVSPVLALLVAMVASATLAAQEVRAVLVERIQELNLTDEQEAKIAEIQKAGRPKVEAAAKELAAVAKEEADKALAVLTPEQKEKVAAAKEDRKELRAEGVCEKIARLQELDLSDAQIAQIEACRKECRPELAKAVEGLRGLLTPEQRKAREEALGSGKKQGSAGLAQPHARAKGEGGGCLQGMLRCDQGRAGEDQRSPHLPGEGKARGSERRAQGARPRPAGPSHREPEGAGADP